MSVRKTYAVLALILSVCLLRAGPLFGQASRGSTQKGDEEIHVTADSLSVREGGKEIEGKGNIELKRQEMTLKADEVWVNRETQDMEAQGNVSVDDPEWKLKKGDRARFNLGEETGTIENGDMFLEKGHLSLSGSRLQKLPGQAYHIDDGFFTTCLCESGPPTWKISGAEIDIAREGEARIRGGVFYIMDVPVFYIPYVLFPVRSERQSGLLFPQFGTSSKRGFWYMQPFYWAISKSSDATLTFDVETRARLGFIGQYRTIFSRDAQAEIDVSYFNEHFRDNPDSAVKDRTIADCHPKAGGGVDCDVIPQNRWSAIANHRQTSSSGWTTYSDIALFSDDFFTRELTRNLHFNFDQERDIKTSRYSLSRAGFLRSWGDVSLQGEWDFYQDFIQADKRTLQRAPQIAFTGRTALWNTPLELRWRATGVNYLSREAPDGLRIDLRPELVLPFNLANYLHGLFSVAPRETAYHLYDNSKSFSTTPCGDPSDPTTCTKSRRTFARNTSRELVEVAGNVGSSFGRVFSWDGSELQKIKHVVEPEVSYRFVSRSKQSDIPIMDGTDRLNHRNMVTFSLTNRFWGKLFPGVTALPEERDVELVAPPTAGDTRELGRLRLAISYDMEKERAVAARHSDLDINLRITPKDYLAFGADTGLSPGAWQVSQAAVLFSILDPRPITRRVLDKDFMRPNSLDLSYRFIGKTRNSLLAENANLVIADPSLPKSCGDAVFDPRCKREDVLGLVGVGALLHLTDNLLFLYNSNYNVRRGGFTTNRGALKILSQCECWTLTLSVNQTTNPNETNFRFNFNLLGLGSQAKEVFK